MLIKSENKHMYLPDSNILILAFHGHKAEAVFLEKCIMKRQLKISVIVLAEIYAGVNEIEKRSIDDLVTFFGEVPVDSIVARVAGEYRRQLARKKKRAYLADCFLAAQAKVHNLILVTNNKADFPMKDIKIISS